MQLYKSGRWHAETSVQDLSRYLKWGNSAIIESPTGTSEKLIFDDRNITFLEEGEGGHGSLHKRMLLNRRQIARTQRADGEPKSRPLRRHR